MAAKPAGSFLYEEGHRLCVLASGRGDFRKTHLQGEFSEFGHIIQIETPKSGLAFVVFKDRADAKEAMECMDGKSVNGVSVTVNWAGPKPSGAKQQSFNESETPANERTGFSMKKDVLTTESFVRDAAASRRAWSTLSDKVRRSRSRKSRGRRSRSNKSRSRRSRSRKSRSRRSRSRRTRSHSGRRARNRGRSRSEPPRRRSRSRRKRLSNS
mmetsp:Transcript_597/g.994  ORF Transcript_597/g.994 Transcript_597/m.994 type:complete len:212 (+) Transcript_597:92-727(+)